MSSTGLNQQVEAYDQWRHSLAREVSHYVGWLRKNRLSSTELEDKLMRQHRLLQSNQLSIAFVGEFSRGKTELINALFFAGYGDRMLPSQAGRTTMCPSEIAYDPEAGCCLKLLPIETRQEEHALSYYRDHPDYWQVSPLDTRNTEAMRETLAQVAEVKSMPFEGARSLGFEVSSLEQDPDRPGNALVPAWRHALISTDHPILKQGLRIIDTPGLNALGAEPELTVSLIPGADAIIYLLDANNGVTASDLESWQQHIKDKDTEHHALRFAVLNKIDTLSDELRSAEDVERMIRDIQQKSAEQLGLDKSEVLPLSARQALIARTRNDEELLQHSRLPALESLISDRLLTRKERLMSRDLVSDILGMLQTSTSILNARLTSLEERLTAVGEGAINSDYLKELTDNTRRDHGFYYKKLFTVRSSRRLMKSQSLILERLVNRDRFEEHANQTREELIGSWTTMGMGRSMLTFFRGLDDDLANLRHETQLAQKMVDSIYKRYNQDLPPGAQIHPPAFTMKSSQAKLRQLQERAERFRLHASTLFSEQTVVVKRFFNTLVEEARRAYLSMGKDAQRWPQEALMPLLQNTIEQKETLEHQIARLKELSEAARDGRSQKRKLETMISDIQAEIQHAEAIQKRIRRPAPLSLQQKVVNLPGMHAKGVNR